MHDLWGVSASKTCLAPPSSTLGWWESAAWLIVFSVLGQLTSISLCTCLCVHVSFRLVVCWTCMLELPFLCLLQTPRVFASTMSPKDFTSHSVYIFHKSNMMYKYTHFVLHRAKPLTCLLTGRVIITLCALSASSTSPIWEDFMILFQIHHTTVSTVAKEETFQITMANSLNPYIYFAKLC